MRPVYPRRGSRGKFIEFHGRASKTYKGGLKDKELANKNIRHNCQDGKINYIFHVFMKDVNEFSHFFNRRSLSK